jgi:RNA polymerase sigma-70 factor (ECF subfamily)
MDAVVTSAHAHHADRAEPVATTDLSEARDRDFVERVRLGDEDAFRALFARYAAIAQALALRIVRRPHLAEEIVQEVFLRVWTDPSAYDGARGSVRAWLMGMVHHRAVDLVRREETHRRVAQRSAGVTATVEADPAEQVSVDVDLAGERAAVRAALDALPPEQRRVIELMYYEGRSQTQISEETGLPLGTVKSRTLLGMRRLRSSLGALER